MSTLRERLLAVAAKRETAHLDAARRAVLTQFKAVSLKAAEKALVRALSLPAGKRPAAVRTALLAIREASAAAGSPPSALLGILRRATYDRVLNTRDLALLTDPTLTFPDPKEHTAQSVAKQRQDMNDYWAGESKRFRDDAAKTVREAVRRGLDPEKAADLLQDRLKVHRSRAVLIAQDQLLTASSRAEIDLLKAARVSEFMWQTMGDSRVRPAHARLHGKVFTWRSAPELPGRAIRCRCRAVLPPDAEQISKTSTLDAEAMTNHSERPREGLQFKSASGQLDRKEEEYILRGIHTAGLLEYLKHEPLKSIEFISIPDSGRYFWPSRRLQLKFDRAPATYGEKFVAGQCWSISSVGKSRLSAVRRSLAHELGHHILWIHARDFHPLAQKAYAQATGRHISQYAAVSWAEYFCETFAAYAYHRAALKKHDPYGYAMMLKVEEVLNETVKQRNSD